MRLLSILFFVFTSTACGTDTDPWASLSLPLTADLPADIDHIEVWIGGVEAQALSKPWPETLFVDVEPGTLPRLELIGEGGGKPRWYGVAEGLQASEGETLDVVLTIDPAGLIFIPEWDTDELVLVEAVALNPQPGTPLRYALRETVRGLEAVVPQGRYALKMTVETTLLVGPVVSDIGGVVVEQGKTVFLDDLDL